MFGRVELGLSYQCVEHCPVEIRPFLFHQEAVCSFGGTDLEDAVDLPVVMATFRGEVEIRDERQSPQLLEKRLDGRPELHCVHYYYMSITNGQYIIKDCPPAPACDTAMTYVDMDWEWLVRNAKVRDRQNRLGFAVSLASEVSEGRKESERAGKLRSCLEVLERARLAREDTFCHDSMTQAERVWLREHRSASAAHWNLLTDMKGEHLAYASE
jgi:hypothetical protein